MEVHGFFEGEVSHVQEFSQPVLGCLLGLERMRKPIGQVTLDWARSSRGWETSSWPPSHHSKPAIRGVTFDWSGSDSG